MPYTGEISQKQLVKDVLCELRTIHSTADIAVLVNRFLQSQNALTKRDRRRETISTSAVQVYISASVQGHDRRQLWGVFYNWIENDAMPRTTSAAIRTLGNAYGVDFDSSFLVAIAPYYAQTERELTSDLSRKFVGRWSMMQRFGSANEETERILSVDVTLEDGGATLTISPIEASDSDSDSAQYERGVLFAAPNVIRMWTKSNTNGAKCEYQGIYTRPHTQRTNRVELVYGQLLREWHGTNAETGTFFMSRGENSLQSDEALRSRYHSFLSELQPHHSQTHSRIS